MTGVFEVYVDGVKTDRQIINGSLGMTGNGTNTYGITKGDASVKWLGSLQNCKAALKYILNKEVR
jgi:hypothetical protein